MLAANLPAIYGYRECAEAGGLLSYGSSLPAAYRQGARLVDRILKGAKPADLPIEQADKFELVVNNKTAKALGLKISEAFLLRADEVIEQPLMSARGPRPHLSAFGVGGGHGQNEPPYRVITPQRTSASISCRSREAVFGPYQGTRLSRYDTTS